MSSGSLTAVGFINGAKYSQIRPALNVIAMIWPKPRISVSRFENAIKKIGAKTSLK
ncbi:MAG: hypothetical protein VB031_03545 [Eubacteriaceae bacterium]|nr:hypothetical protein [Eubacteriaceae bacterium]